MNYLECKQLCRIIKDNNIGIIKESASKLVEAVYSGNLPEGISAVTGIAFQLPTMLFWAKMRKFLLNLADDLEGQIKMAEKFTTDNKELNKYVLRMMETVNKIDLDEKINYYAYLTRMLLLDIIDDALFHKLSQVLLDCTLYELEFINSHSEHSRFEYDLTVAALKNMMLARQDTDCDTTLYMFTDLAKTLKTYSLCCDDSVPKPRKTLRDVIAVDDMVLSSDHEVNEMLVDMYGE